jgi:uncharacterized membrane protein YdfJ with MMPL/SSD domain
MSPQRPSYNIAARMGRWSAAHWKTAVIGWLAFVILAVAIGVQVGQKQTSMQGQDVGQSQRANQLLKQAAFKQSDPMTEIVVVQSKTATIDDPAFRATVNDVVRTVRPFATIRDIRSPLVAANADQISRDRRTALVEWQMRGTDTQAAKNIDQLTRATASVAKANPRFYVGETGSVSLTRAGNKLFTEQVAKAGEKSIPLTLILLLLVFGAAVAAFVPLALALSSVLATIGLSAIVSQVLPMDGNVNAVILLVGLAVGVDYTLFYLRREREERAAGKGARAALEAAAATSGRAVLISGLTVVVAMAGMLFTDDKTFMGFAIATMMVVIVAMLGSLTVLPALLSRLGDRVERGRIPFLGRFRRDSGENRFWARILTLALRRPWIAAIAAAAALVTLAIPTTTMHTAQSGIESMPRSVPSVMTFNRLQASFPGTSGPALVAVRTDTNSSAFKRAVADLRERALASGEMHNPIRVDTNAKQTAARIQIPLAGDGYDDVSNQALRDLRDKLVPGTIGKVPGAAYAVAGQTASAYDQNQQMKDSAPLVFGFVLMLAFLLLLVSFRSVVIAFKAIVLNLLSVAAAYGVLVAAFQYGWGSSLLEFTSNGGIAWWLPIFMFVILFGLSMDYNVFILSRIREAYDRGMKTEDAVAHGIKTTAGTVTSAAAIMVGVFLIFTTLPILDMKEMGLGLAAAILIDATIVRAILLPATMKLLGDWNWYLPHWLNWLPRLETERLASKRVEPTQPAPQPAG